MNKNIGKGLLKDALLDLDNVSSMIKESSKESSKELIEESLHKVLSNLITESDDDKSEDTDDEEEVKDTYSTDVESDEDDELDNEEPEDDNDEDDECSDNFDDNSSECDSTEDNFDNCGGIEDSDDEDDENQELDDESDDEGWSEFDKYKVGDAEYDFTSADEDDLTSVYSILKNDDNIDVRKDGDSYIVDNGETEFEIIPTDSMESGDADSENPIEAMAGGMFGDMFGDIEDMADNMLDDGDDDNCESHSYQMVASNDNGHVTGTECNDGECNNFEIELGDDEPESDQDESFDDEEDGDEPDFEDEDEDQEQSEEDDSDTDNNVKENRIMRNTIYEISLNEDNLGYGMKQTKPAFTTPTDSAHEVEWDDVEHGDNKPNLKKSATPFTKGKANEGRRGRRIFEGDDMGLGADYGDSDMDDIEEAMTRFGGRDRGKKMSLKSETQPNDAPEGQQVIVKADASAQRLRNAKNESIMRRMNTIMKENTAIKTALKKFEKNLTEAAVANVNLQNALKLVTENTTSAAEKKSIVKQFSTVKTLNESKMLYNSIKKSLTGSKANSLNEAVARKSTIAAKPAPNKEKVIYKSQDLNESLDLMARMAKTRL